MSSPADGTGGSGSECALDAAMLELLRAHQERLDDCLTSWSKHQEAFMLRMQAVVDSLHAPSFTDKAVAQGASVLISPSCNTTRMSEVSEVPEERNASKSSSSIGMQTWIAEVSEGPEKKKIPKSSSSIGMQTRIAEVPERRKVLSSSSSLGMPPAPSADPACEIERESSRWSASWKRKKATSEASRQYSIASPLEVGRRIREIGCATWIQMQVSALTSNLHFDVFCGVVILLNATLIGVETNSVAATGKTTPELRRTMLVINMWYILELLLRIVAGGKRFFCGKDWRWSWFDFLLVSMSVFDMVFDSLSFGGMAVGRTMRAVRLVRVLRMLRLGRMLRYVGEFKKMVFSLAASVQTLFWSLLLVLFILFCFGVFFTQAASDYLHGSATLRDSMEQDLQRSFGSLGASMYSLYSAITAGRDWTELAEILSLIHPSVTCVFLVFVSICIFGVMNVATAVFVESAMRSSQHYRDLLVQERLVMERINVRHLKEIFSLMDTDGSGTINQQEMRAFLEDHHLQLQDYFEALDINATDTDSLFVLLDHDQDGELDLEEFCDGCLRLRGTATAFDLNCLQHDMRRSGKHTLRALDTLTGAVKQIKSGQKSQQIALSEQVEKLDKTIRRMVRATRMIFSGAQGVANFGSKSSVSSVGRVSVGRVSSVGRHRDEETDTSAPLGAEAWDSEGGDSATAAKAQPVGEAREPLLLPPLPAEPPQVLSDEEDPGEGWPTDISLEGLGATL